VDFRVLYRVSGDKKVVREAYPEKLGARFWWVVKLVSSMRFVGWETGDSERVRPSEVVESRG